MYILMRRAVQGVAAGAARRGQLIIRSLPLLRCRRFVSGNEDKLYVLKWMRPPSNKALQTWKNRKTK